MDMRPDNPFARSPRKEIQGPRPTPLKVRKDSHKIRKLPMAPPAAAAAHPHHPPRPPVIIYTVSPKIIHANPKEFMSLVQRLTGPNSSCTAAESNFSSSCPFQENGGGGVSPAARLASMEKIKSPEGRKSQQMMEYDEMGIEIHRRERFPAGILSPNPNALPPLIPQNFFSPPSDSNPLGFFPAELSPILQNGLIFPSPSTLFSPQIIMPSPHTLHLFNTLFDL